MTESDSPVLEALREYEAVTLAWGGAVDSDSGSANALFHRSHELSKALRSTREGRYGLERLSAHADRGVRLIAAADCLPFAPEVAEPVLEAIAAERGLHGITAEYTLKSFRAGTLDLDW